MNSRPRNRKEQLTEAAAELFRRHGYHGVSVNDIAAAAGVTGPAVYRHFRGKQDVLAHVLLSGLDKFGLVTDQALAQDEPLHALVEAVSAMAVERRDVTALWRWQGRHLAKADQIKIRKRGMELMGDWVSALRDSRPELSLADAELLSWAALSVFGSVADHHVTIPKRRFEQLLGRLACAVFRSPVPDSPPAPRPEWQRPATQPSRREELLTVATRLFRERGYRDVSMEDIGAAAGIAGPSVYRHFDGKAELLMAAGYRMADRLTMDARRVIENASSPREALTGLVGSYVDIVWRSDDLLSVFASELGNVPDRDRKELVRVQRAYVAEWVTLLRTVAPRLPEPEARIAVHAALTIVNDLTRTPRITGRPGLVAELTGLAVAVLDEAVLITSAEAGSGNDAHARRDQVRRMAAGEHLAQKGLRRGPGRVQPEAGAR
ncbi:TetR/AcrR family transcriptional regulator [Kibdelosporangium persicum]|uniref:DNA-binding transcriptional repressor FabR n=1 Tax=Kibdelosporangium persicum TaxID=2698649 RepID=A0ABX2FAY6_9PSEU|nr:TetR/AcrR family transcriptional regulator [Kibdelosporangium persicum]NRN68545.1 DNA-binding transcriptional repressor FabR [Kibdelosporangium persicum]